MNPTQSLNHSPRTAPQSAAFKWRSLCTLATALVLAACGGGGGPATTTQPNPEPCVASTSAPSISYSALSATAGTAISPLSPSTNLSTACAAMAKYTVASSASLPAGLSLDVSTGVISGTPTAAQTATFSVTLDVTGHPVATSASIQATVAAPAPKQWTLMVYIAGDNNLAEFAIEDLRELKAATVNSQVNVVVQIEKGSTFALTDFTDNPGTSTYRGLISGSNTKLSDIGATNMSTPESLSSFIQWSKQAYPANHYGLVLWSHGGGWRANKATRAAPLGGVSRGALQDISSGGSLMSLANIRKGIADGMGTDATTSAANKLAVLAFDACLMGQYEVAYELRNTAQYLVASEELVPGPGMPYTQVVNLLSGTTTTPKNFATTMAKAFSDHYSQAASTRDATTMSVIDLSTMDDVHSKIVAFATQAKTNIAANTAAALSTGRLNDNALIFGGTDSATDSIDLWRYADYVATNASDALRTSANALKTSLESAIVANHHTSLSMYKATGLAIYFPGRAADYQSSYATTTAANATLTGDLVSKSTWNDFLSALYPQANQAGTVAGDFAYYITWTNPPGLRVDVDLVINEPSGNWASPSIGTTSVNGFLSGDSYYSAQNFESYSAAAQVEKGEYDVFANLYGCTNSAGNYVDDATCTTRVTLCRKTGVATTFTCDTAITLNRATTTLDDGLYSELPGSTVWTAVQGNSTYPDWHYFGQVTKAYSMPKSKVKKTLIRTKHKNAALTGGLPKK